MNKKILILLIVILLAGGIVAGIFLLENKETPQKKEPAEPTGTPLEISYRPLELLAANSSKNLEGAHDVAINSKGEIFVVEWLEHQIAVLTKDGELIKRIGSQGIEGGKFIEPVSVAVDNQDRIIVADGSRIQIFDTKGNFLTSFGDRGTEPARLIKPQAITTDQEGRVIVLDSFGDRHYVKVFDANGEFLWHFGKTGNGPGEFMFPNDIAVDPQNRILVADPDNRNIQIFDIKGTFLTSFGEDWQGEEGRFFIPKGMTVNSQGHIFVADAPFGVGNHLIHIFDSEGKELLAFGKGRDGIGIGEFNTPVGLAMDESNCLFVAELGNERIQGFCFEFK